MSCLSMPNSTRSSAVKKWRQLPSRPCRAIRFLTMVSRFSKAPSGDEQHVFRRQKDILSLPICTSVFRAVSHMQQPLLYTSAGHVFVSNGFGGNLIYSHQNKQCPFGQYSDCPRPPEAESTRMSRGILTNVSDFTESWSCPDV